jgi:hypothetical protein
MTRTAWHCARQRPALRLALAVNKRVDNRRHASVHSPLRPRGVPWQRRRPGRKRRRNRASSGVRRKERLQSTRQRRLVDMSEVELKRLPAALRCGDDPLRQSWRSNYCAVYAACMLLAEREGWHATRARAWRLFGLTRTLRKHYAGTPLDELRRRLAGGFPRLRWQWFRDLSGLRFLKSIRRQLAFGPTIVVLEAEAADGRIAHHATLLVGCERFSLRCRDPLGGRRVLRGGNVTIDRITGAVMGASYSVKIRGRSWLLLWDR